MMLEDFGCSVAGPVGTVTQALEAVSETGLNGALLDANLHGQSSLPIALALKAAAVPFVVATGYGGIALGGEALQQVPRISKPFSEKELKETLLTAISGPHSGQDA